MGQMGKAIWNMDMREALETMLKEGFPVSRIAVTLNISTASIYIEIKKGVNADEYQNRQYAKYSAKKSVDTQVEEYRKMLIEGRSK